MFQQNHLWAWRGGLFVKLLGECSYFTETSFVGWMKSSFNIIKHAQTALPSGVSRFGMIATT